MKKNFKIKKTLLGLICFFSLFAVATVEDSVSFFSKTQVVTENTITAGYWQQKPKAGDVIINEINWAGSPASKNNKDHDQWIELYNTTDKDIPLKGWVIENASITPKDFKITGNPIIRAGEYLLITRRKDNSAESALNVPSDVQNASLYLNRAEYKQLILKDTDGVEIDKTPVVNNPWPEGEYTEKKKYFSMQRMNNTNETGEKNTSWYTCDTTNFAKGELDLMKNYWKEEFYDYVCGTPRNENLPSDNSDEDSNSLPTPESRQSIQPLDVEEKNKKEDEENGDSARETSVQSDTQSSDSSSKTNEDDDSDTDTGSDEDNEIDEDKDKDDSADNTADDPSESDENNEVINGSEQKEITEVLDQEVNDESGSEGAEESDEEQETTEEDSDENSDDDPSEFPEDSTESSQGTEETESQTSEDNSGDFDEEQSN